MARMTSERIQALLREHGVIDGHNDLLWAAREKVGYDFDRLELTDTEVCQAFGTHTDLPRLRAGGVGAQFWSVYVPATLSGDAAVTATLEQVDAGHTMISRYADQLALATTVEDVERAWQQGKIASLMGAEGGHQINESLGTLRMLHRIGVRYLTLTHNDNVPVGRLGHRRARARRALRLRSRGGRRDEPHRHAGRSEPRQRRRHAPGARRLQRAGHLLPLLGPGAVQPPAQRARRRAARGSPATAGCAWSPSCPSS